MTRLNRAVVETFKVPHGKDSVIAWDSAQPGFGVRINAGGTRSFVAQYRNASGATKRLSLGRYEAMSIDDARRLARSTLAKATTGSDPAEEQAKAKARASITVGSVADAYLRAAESRLKPRSHQEVTRHLTKHWEPLRPSPVHLVKRADVATTLRDIAGSRGEIAANRARASLSAMFTWGMGEGMVESNPTIGTNKAADERSRDHVLTDAELRSVLRACGDDHHGRIVRLLILTGQRRDEVGGMALSEINGALWSLPGARTKNRLPHDVALSPVALEVIRLGPLRVGRDLIFGTRENGFSGWSKAKSELDARILSNGDEVRPWRLHDLRRTAATGMAALGTLPHVVEAVLNHISGHRAGVAGIYNRHAYAAEKRAALDEWSNHVAKISTAA
ncbi:integrase arm-type DNA-binding domain-containing protein [Methylobacterium sp. J-048]|uniref:tyrosine-type recombinase/integrase n=1 Tax=Methylobacterium sp. J-048 TaxID=2836635 RepID=UPI001FBABFCF|nr:site-specific integrase [Methylobacterium sp. J-048]MCJ2055100.1 integrase arm-type DNA-binding domain-containing protein [Methylobacterium sp. J-048]